MLEWFSKGDSAPAKPKFPFTPKKKGDKGLADRDESSGVPPEDEDEDEDEDEFDKEPSDDDGYREMKKAFPLIPAIVGALSSGAEAGAAESAIGTVGRAAAGAAANAVSSGGGKSDSSPDVSGDPTLKGGSGSMRAKRKPLRPKDAEPATKVPDRGEEDILPDDEEDHVDEGADIDPSGEDEGEE